MVAKAPSMITPQHFTISLPPVVSGWPMTSFGTQGHRRRREFRRPGRAELPCPQRRPLGFAFPSTPGGPP